MRNNPYSQNNSLNRWIEKLQEYDFKVRYIKGETMGQPDELSKETSLITNRSAKTISIREEKHLFEKEEKNIGNLTLGKVEKYRKKRKPLHSLRKYMRS